MWKLGYWLGSADISAGGVGPYAWRILETLLGNWNPRTMDLYIFCDEGAQNQVQKLIQTYQVKAQIVVIPEKFSFLQRAANQVGKLLAQARREWSGSNTGRNRLNPWYRWLASFQLDLLHIPLSCPPHHELPCPFVVTMHDVQEIHFPEFFTPQLRALRATQNWQTLEHCSAVVVSYLHVQRDLQKYFGLPESKIFVCPIPHQKIVLQQPNPEEEKIYQQKYGTWKNFLLYPAQTWPHKNHMALIQAVEQVRQKSGKSVQLICTGRKHPQFFPVIADYLDQSPVATQVHFVDIVPERELAWLYKNCALVVIPTLYEAGSFPLLEAMALGAPVICSAVTSLPDTIGDRRFLFDPRNIDDLAHLILRMLDQPNLRQENVVNGQNRTRELQALDPAASLFQVWRKVLGKSPGEHSWLSAG
jgi:glycosyltransferase involved in cell wall biosynthesis